LKGKKEVAPSLYALQSHLTVGERGGGKKKGGERNTTTEEDAIDKCPFLKEPK